VPSDDRPALDRRAHLRPDPHLLDDLWTAPTTRVIIVAHGLIPTIAHDDGTRHIPYLTPDQASDLREQAITCYLGADAGLNTHDYIALLLGQEMPTFRAAKAAESPKPPHLLPWPDKVDWLSLGHLSPQLSAIDEAVARAASALAGWHPVATHCPECGSQTEVTDSGWVRTCPQDQGELYPRTDPVVIVRIRDDADRILLAHGAAWVEKRYSLPAGYVEAGETLEEAVIREIAEETAIEVDHVRYLGSQSWPMPRSLMCAFDAHARSTNILVDQVELSDARWFTRAELAAALERGEVRLSVPGAIARRVIDEWLTCESLPPV